MLRQRLWHRLFLGELATCRPQTYFHALGGITLVDIRRSDEWAQTGSGVGAHGLDVRRDDFIPELMKLVMEGPSKPIAVICARGHRSFQMRRALMNAGFTNIIDVPEGVLGSRAGPGWIARPSIETRLENRGS